VVLAAWAVAIVTCMVIPAAAAHHHHQKQPVHHHHGTGTGADLTLEESELPLKWLFVSLGISAAIGAVAGEVIVNLTGSRP
jgi:hypothetical protein